MAFPISPSKIAAWSLAVIAATYLAGTVATTLRVIGTERINRRTQISVNSSEITLVLTLPKGTWTIGFAESYEDIAGRFELTGAYIRQSRIDSKGVTFITEKDFTKVFLKCEFEGAFGDKFLEIGATF